MTRQVVFSLISLGFVLGCSSATGNSPFPSPVPETTSAPVVIPEADNDGRHKTWKITPTQQSQTYQSTVKTTITERDRPENRQSGFTTVADYSLKLLRSSATAEIFGSVTAFRVEADHANERSIPVSFVLPLNFEGNISEHNILLRSLSSNQSAGSCSDSSKTVLSIINRDLIFIPQEIAVTQGWQDSTSNSICSGSLPVVISLIRNYRIISETAVDGVPALELERTEKILTSGGGSQGQHQISIKGTGTGKAHLFVNLASGFLLSLTATNQVELSITSSGRTQNFIQTSEENVVRKIP